MDLSNLIVVQVTGWPSADLVYDLSTLPGPWTYQVPGMRICHWPRPRVRALHAAILCAPSAWRSTHLVPVSMLHYAFPLSSLPWQQIPHRMSLAAIYIFACIQGAALLSKDITWRTCGLCHNSPRRRMEWFKQKFNCLSQRPCEITPSMLWDYHVIPTCMSVRSLFLFY